MYVPDFEELAGDEDTFFTDYFNRRPLLRREALRAPASKILTLANLDQLLYSEALRPPYLRISKGGTSVLPETYTGLMRVQGEYITDCIIPDLVMGHFRTGATITWNSINHFLPNLRALTTALATRFSARSDVIAFLTPPGREGFAPHYDPVELFIVQLHGTKYWRVWPFPEVRRGDGAPVSKDKLGEPVLATSLSPGDVLYLPYNTPHVAVAEEAVSLHLSIMVRPRRWSDLLQRIVQLVLEEDPTFWEYPYLNTERRHFLEGELQTNIARLTDRLKASSPSSAVADLISWGSASEGAGVGTPFVDLVRADSLSVDSVVERHPNNTVLVKPAASGQDVVKASLVVDGSTYEVPNKVAERVSELVAGGSVLAGQFLEASPESSIRFVKKLVYIGAVHISVDT